MTVQLDIDRLQLSIENGAGQEHRIRPIVLRATDILADRLDGVREAGSRDVEHVSAGGVSLDLHAMSDEQAASTIAGAVLEALSLKLGV